MDILNKQKKNNNSSKTHLTLDQKRQIREEAKRLQILSDVKKKYPNIRKLSDLQYRYLEKGIENICYYDIECSDFNPLGNFIIGYVAIIRNIVTGKTEEYEYNISKKDIHDAVTRDSMDFDYKLLGYLSDCVNSCDALIGHFSTKFDTPYFRTRCLLTHQEYLIPDYRKIKQGDTWRMMKNSMKAPRNTLMNFALYTDTPNQKTHVAMKHWQRIRFPKNPNWQKSMDYIMDHCRKDVRMTMRAHKKIEKFNAIGSVLV